MNGHNDASESAWLCSESSYCNARDLPDRLVEKPLHAETSILRDLKSTSFTRNIQYHLFYHLFLWLRLRLRLRWCWCQRYPYMIVSGFPTIRLQSQIDFPYTSYNETGQL
jgi:hypothetical protein